MDTLAEIRAALAERYRIERELGSGASAIVYLAHDLRHHRHVAIKVLRPELTSGFSSDRFLREIRIAASLQHPHILALLDSGEAAGSVYCVMPYVKGETLRARLMREKVLPVEEAVRLTRQIADALACAHREGVVHRDIKPENILLADGEAYLADFGIAHSLESELGDRLTLTGMSLGTPHYMSPEQATGERDVDGRSDVYSLACVTYEMLAGEAPFDGPNAQAVIARHLQQPPPSLRIVRQTVPDHVDEAVQRALAKAPVDRFSDAAAFSSALIDTNARPTGSRLGAARRTRWQRVLPLAVTLVVGAVAARAAWVRLAVPSYDPDLVAVAPFDTDDPALGPWRQELLGLLAANLNGAGPLRVVPPTQIEDQWRGRADEASAVALGRRTAARSGVVGAIFARGADSVRIRAAVYDAQSARLLDDLQVVVPVGRVDRGADSLAVGVLRVLGRERPLGASRPPSSGPSAMAALKTYLQGEIAFRQMDWDAAQQLYERAVQLDTNYALAFHRLSAVRSMRGSGIDSLIWFNALRAGRLHRGLPERDSLLVMVDSLQAALWYAASVRAPDGQVSLVATLKRRLFTTLEVANRRYPDDAELWYLLSVHLEQLGDPSPERYRRIFNALNRTIALDSSFLPAYPRAISLAAELEGAPGARRFLGSYVARVPNGAQANEARLGALLFDARRSGRREVERLLAETPPGLLLRVWSPLFWWYDSAETAVQVARRIVDHDDASRLDPRGMAYPEFILAVTLASRGRVTDACAAMTESPQRILFPQLALLGCEPAETASAKVTDLAQRFRWMPDRVTMYVPWWSAIGDTARLVSLRRLGDSLARAAPDVPSRAGGRALSSSVRGHLALARGDSAEALARFEDEPDASCQFCDAQRLAKSRLLDTHGRTRQAVSTLSEVIDGNIFPFALLMRLQRARFSEKLGDHASAIDDYGRVAAAWRLGDPAMRDSAEVARLAFDRLSKAP